jgi:hypothetical protein
MAFLAARGPREDACAENRMASVNAAAIDGVDEQPEAAEAATVEAKHQPRQMRELRLIPLQRQ